MTDVFRLVDPTLSKRRAVPACDSCRKRKVRCDLGLSDAKCTPCSANDFDCRAACRENRRQGPRRRARNGAALGLNSGQLSSPNAPGKPRSASAHLGPSLSLDHHDIYHDVLLPATPSSVPSSSHEALQNGTIPRAPQSATVRGQPRDSDWDSASDHLFLCCNALKDVAPSDLAFLELNGCFKVPRRSIMKSFVGEFFSFVHPALPVLEAHEFIVAFGDFDSNGTSTKNVSIFLMQALLAASCVFLPPHTLRDCGFADYHSARHTLCRRASLLYDFGVWTDPLTVAKGALLLSLVSPYDDLIRGNACWIDTAVRFLRTKHTAASNEGDSVHQRLWWCVIIRDRTLALMMRRPLRLPSDAVPSSVHLQFEENTVTGALGESFVFSGLDTNQVCQLFGLQFGLSASFTDLVSLIYPASGSLGPKVQSSADAHDFTSVVAHHESILNYWESKISTWRASHVQVGDIEPAVLLFTSRLIMQILTARIALSFTLIATCSLHPEHFTNPAPSLINDAARTISESVVTMANTAHELSSLGLETKSDMQDPAWCIFPMCLLQLTLKLSIVSEDQSAIKYHMQHLHRYMEAHRQRWDGIDRVLSRLNVLGPPSISGANSPAPAINPAWDLASMSRGVTHRLFRQYLTSYLRLGTAYNLCISNSTATDAQDMPPMLETDHCESAPTTQTLVAGRVNERSEPEDDFTNFNHDGDQQDDWQWDRLSFHDALLGDLDEFLSTYATW